MHTLKVGLNVKLEYTFLILHSSIVLLVQRYHAV